MIHIKSVLLLFDYFKEAFRLNRTNRALYGPQILLILARMVLLAGIGIWAFMWLGGDRFHSLLVYGGTPRQILRILIEPAGVALGGLGLWLLVVRLIEAGLFNMYKTAVQSGAVQEGAFGAGVAKFFLPFVLGDLALGVIFVVLIPVWLLVGIVTLSIGFTLFWIAVGVFLMFWKVSLVWNERGVIDALKDSFRFAWQHLFGVTALYLIRRAFASPLAGGGNGGSSNIQNMANYSNGNVPSFNPYHLQRFLRIGVSIAVPVIILLVTVYTLIRMLFDVFFGLAVFVTYKNGFTAEPEVSPDVV